MQHGALLALVDLLYAAALDPAGWTPFLHLLSNTLQGSGAGLTFAHSDGRVHIHTGVGIWGAEFQAAYPMFVSCDPWVLRARELDLFKTGTIGVGEALVSDRELERTRFYADFGRPHDYVGGVSSLLVADQTALAAVSVCRRPNQSFGQAEVDIMRELMPHLQRALAVHTRLSAAHARQQGLRHTLDRLATGAILLAGSGAVLFVNDSARATLAQRDGITIERGELRGECASDTAKLRGLTSVASGLAGGARSGGVVLLERPSGRRRLQVIVSPLPEADAIDDPHACVIVFVTDPERMPAPDLALLRQVYDLSRTEADVARLLVQDKTVQEIGAILGTSVNTVRFHLKQLFSKTGTRRQSELVRMVLTTAQVRHP